MNASTTPDSLRSFRLAIASALAMTALAALVACNKSADAGADGGSASTTTTTSGKKPKTTQTLAGLKAAYASEIDNTAKMKDPIDKKVAGFVAKVGAPASDSGRVKTWYAMDGAKCSKVDIDTKDGSITDSTTANSDCGM